MTARRAALLLAAGLGSLATLAGHAPAQDGLTRERASRVDGTRAEAGARPEGGLRGRERVDGTATGGPTHWVVESPGATSPMLLPVPVPVPVPRQTPAAARPPIRAGSIPSAAQ